MSGDPFPGRCRGCHVPLEDDVEFCDDPSCERRYAERRVLRRLAVINTMAHVARYRRRLRRWLHRRA